MIRVLLASLLAPVLPTLLGCGGGVVCVGVSSRLGGPTVAHTVAVGVSPVRFPFFEGYCAGQYLQG